MTSPAQVEEAFEVVSKQPEPAQSLLRHVLVQWIQDPSAMRALGTLSLEHHLLLAGKVLFERGRKAVQMVPMPPREEAFVHLTVGHDLSDAEEAYAYVGSLQEADLRKRVGDGLLFAIGEMSNRIQVEPTSLLALARILTLAYQDAAFVDHVASGHEVEPFLDISPQGTRNISQQDTRTPRYAPGSNPGSKESRTQEGARPKPTSWRERFGGQYVEIAVANVPTRSSDDHESHVLRVRGYCLEVGNDYVVISTMSHVLNADPARGLFLFGIPSIIYMRTMPPRVDW